MAKKDYINRTRLRKIIDKEKVVLGNLAVEIGITYMSLWRKLNKGVEFNEGEIKYLTRRFGEEIIIK